MVEIGIVCALLQQSLSSIAVEVKEADAALKKLSEHENFVTILLKIILDCTGDDSDCAAKNSLGECTSRIGDGGGGGCVGIDRVTGCMNGNISNSAGSRTIVSDDVKLSASIFLKNFIRRNWFPEGNEGSVCNNVQGVRNAINVCSDREDDGWMLINFSDERKQWIRRNLLETLLVNQNNRPVIAQILEIVRIISETDFPRLWTELIPMIRNNFLQCGDVTVCYLGLQVLQIILQKYGRSIRSNDVLEEMKMILNNLQESVLTFFGIFVTKIQELQNQADSHSSIFLQSLGHDQSFQKDIVFSLLSFCSLCKIFYFLNVIDIPEFFEDNSYDFFRGFVSVLNTSFSFVRSLPSSPLLPSNIVQQLKCHVCENLILYSDKYQEETIHAITSCILSVWNVIEQLDDSKINDDLFCTAIKFLSSACKTQWAFHEIIDKTKMVKCDLSRNANMCTIFNITDWNSADFSFNPFMNPNFINLICKVVVMKNLQLRESEINLLEDDPEEYVRHTIDTREDESRRDAAFNLIKSLNKLYFAYTSDVLTSYINEIMGNRESLNDEKCKEAVCHLITSVATKSHSIRCGITEVYANINFYAFYETYLKPELLNEDVNCRIFVRSAAIKFIENFRNFFPQHELVAVLNMLKNCLCSRSPVVHTYAANCLDKILILRDKNQFKINFDQNKDVLLQALGALRYTLMSNTGIFRNEYLSKCLMRLVCILKHYTRDLCMDLLSDLISIVKSNSSNPSNPLFIHFIFEGIAVLIKLYAQNHTLEIEKIVLPVISVIVELGMHDFLPYCLQILSLVVSYGSVNPSTYMPFYEHLLNNSLWTVSNANVPGIIALLGAFFEKYKMFEEIISKNMEQILGKFQYCLNQRKLIGHGFDLLNNIFLFLPYSMYQQFFQTLLLVIFRKLQERKNDQNFSESVLLSLSIFTCVNGGEIIPKTLNQIQPGFNDNVGRYVLIAAANELTGLQNRKICALAFSKLLLSQEYLENEDLLIQTIVTLNKVLLGFEKLDMSRYEIKDDEKLYTFEANELEFEVFFNKLKAASLPSKANFLAEVDILDFVRKNLIIIADKLKEILIKRNVPEVVSILVMFNIIQQ